MKSLRTIRFFDHLYAYSVHGDDVNLIAQMVYQSTSQITQIIYNDIHISCLTIYKNDLEKVIRELLMVHNVRVEIYGRRFLYSDWEIEYRGSPAYLSQFEKLIFSNKKESYIDNRILSVNLCLKDSQYLVGLALIDQNLCQLKIMEFADDYSFTKFQAICVMLAPRECLLPDEKDQYNCVKHILEKNGILVTIHQSLIPYDDFILDLNKILRSTKGYKQSSYIFFEIKWDISIEALKLAIDYLDLTSDPCNMEQFHISHMNLNSFVHMDFASANILKVLPPYGCESVLTILDHCQMPQGHRLMTEWIKQPLRCVEIINHRHNMVECFTQFPNILHLLHNGYLKRIPDLLILVQKLQRKKANLKDVFDIYEVILRSHKIVKILHSVNDATIARILCHRFHSALDHVSYLEQLLEQVLDFEAVNRKQYVIKSSSDRVLQNTKEQMACLLQKMAKCQELVSKNLDLELNFAVKLVNVADYGYTLIVRSKDATNLYKNTEYKILDIYNNEIFFTTQTLSAFNKEFFALKNLYEKEHTLIVEEIFKLTVYYSEHLLDLNAVFAELDCLLSFAKIAQSDQQTFVRPIILTEGSGEFIVKDIKLPWIKEQKTITFLAHKMDISKDRFGKTGLKMQLNSKYMPAVITVILMALVGSFVPCSEAKISLIDSIFTDVETIAASTSSGRQSVYGKPSDIVHGTDKGNIKKGCNTPWLMQGNSDKEDQNFILYIKHLRDAKQSSPILNDKKKTPNVPVGDTDNNQNFNETETNRSSIFIENIYNDKFFYIDEDIDIEESEKDKLLLKRKNQ
ncbi:DNA mismatch repair protein spellchecker 1-like isoform X2 [Haematobia irritans]|uniref:DNA mismatch repair protein spellchecker 1-like isoform X2 n=1 Tax=Haematobia irritans TaxID=7368 RepID=UPI003F4F70FE